MRVILLCMLIVASSPLPGAEPGLPKHVDYNRHIRPILSENCFRCHGPDAQTREAGLRLDLRDSALSALESGDRAIVPQQPDQSELLRRIDATDVEDMMPPPETNKKLSARERQLVRRWIEQGAEYHPHWAFAPLRRPELPTLPGSAHATQPIDAFVAVRLAEEGLQMSPEADRATLIRRLSLDLTGLPPTPDEVEAFEKDQSPAAYEKVVDRLLASPRYAERMATSWLDLARYADTHGYNNDGERTQWPWRDWVINAFDKNLPYEQFIVEQLAGDLLENATDQQRLATAFNRNHVITSEGGIIEEEYRVEYVADRVHTTATVFLGLSMQCARCHDHKFDPITQRDYYSFFAFFNNVPEGILGYGGAIVSAAPARPIPSPYRQADVERIAARIKELDLQRVAREAASEPDFARWQREPGDAAKAAAAPAGLVARLALDEGTGTITRDAAGAGREGTIVGSAKWTEGRFGKALEFDGQTYVDFQQLVSFDHDRPFSISVWINPTSLTASTVVSKMDDAGAYRGFDLIIEEGKPAVHLIHHWPDDGLKVKANDPLTLNAWHHLLVVYDGSSHASGVTIYVNGAAAALTASNDNLRSTFQTDKPVHLGRRAASVPFQGQIDEAQFFATALTADDARRLVAGQALAAIADVLAIAPAERTDAQNESLKRFYLDTVDPTYKAIQAELAAATREKDALAKDLPPVMVMEEMPAPRQAFVLRRGQYDQPGDPISPQTPASLPAMPAGAPANRLGLARWLVDPNNPLTARVAVNRWWQMYFGNGIVETVEDFGSQGALPSHPELLDWLAVEFIASGWNVKALQKQIVMSACYRQSSHTTAELRERDPKNLLLARGARFRLPAEMLRDNALAISGLLVDRVGGPSVRPYQPDGLWQDVSVERKASYQPDTGEGVYRRGMYTFWKRTCPPPAMQSFDAPDRETCLIRRARTNTPLQALVLMNDPTYVEAARKLAEQAISSGPDDSGRLNHAFRLALARDARPAEQQALLSLVKEARARFTAAPARAEELLKTGQSPRNPQFDAAELAAWTTAASVILNLDETITRQ